MANTVRVHLADAPTDVLVYLVGVPFGEYRDVGQILEAVAPTDAVDAALTVATGLRTLLDAGYAGRGRVGERTEFWATTAGRLAVAEAVAAAEVVTPSRTDRQPPDSSSVTKGGETPKQVFDSRTDDC